MRKSFLSKFALFFLGLLIILCPSCEPKETKAPVPEKQPKLLETEQQEIKQPEVKQPEVKQPEVKQLEVKQPETKAPVAEGKPKEQPTVELAADALDVVAKISDYAITKEALEKRLMERLHPDEYEEYLDDGEPINAETALLELVAEKAMIMEGRKLNLLEDETISRSVRNFRERRLTNLLYQKYLEEHLRVSESEIEEKIKTKPNLDRARAKAEIERAKAKKLVNDYYQELYKSFHVRKLRENYPKAAEVHYRLLYRPKVARKMNFIRITQLTAEMTPEEQNLPLAVYDHGKVTLKYWLETLCEIVPPSRPRDLNSAKGVERLLDSAIRKRVFISEAELRGLDKDKDFLKQLREYEDSGVLAKAKREKRKGVKEPTSEEMKAYYNNNKEEFRIDRSLKTDQIWCANLKIAQEVKSELDNGENFESVRRKYSLEKEGKPIETYASSEARFFKDLWKGKVNELLGPMKGFYRKEFKWRIVKILEKNPGRAEEYSKGMENNVKYRITDKNQLALMKEYAKELLGKYPYEIYAEKIKDIDPLNIP